MTDAREAMTLTAAQRNVRHALGSSIRHTLDGGEGAVVFVTTGFYAIDLHSTVVAVEPDGTVSSWVLNHDWTRNGAGWQAVSAEPQHYSLEDQWRDRWLAGEGDCTAPGGRVPDTFKYLALNVARTEDRPRWHVRGVVRCSSDYVNRDVYDVPEVLDVALRAIYGADIPTAPRTQPGRRHGE